MGQSRQSGGQVWAREVRRRQGEERRGREEGWRQDGDGRGREKAGRAASVRMRAIAVTHGISISRSAVVLVGWSGAREREGKKRTRGSCRIRAARVEVPIGYGYRASQLSRETRENLPKVLSTYG